MSDKGCVVSVSGATAILLVVDQLDSYHQELLHGILEATDAAGLAVLAHAVDPRTDRMPGTLTRVLASGRICGVISTHLANLAVHEGVSELLHESGRRMPVVYIGAHPKATGWTVSDNTIGMRALLAHLLDEVGVRKPVVLRGIPHQPDSQEREALVREELQRRGLPLEPEFVVDGGFARMASYRGLSNLLRSRRDMDAVIAFNDRSAVGAADALKQAGLRVPEDVVLTGFDNEPMAADFEPPLTSVDQDLSSQGRAAAKMVIDHVNGELTSHEVRVATKLVVRASSRRSLASTRSRPAPARGPSAAADVTLAMSRAFMACSTVEHLTDELIVNLPRLGVQRCAMVLEYPDGSDPEHGRLVVDFDADSDASHVRDIRFPLSEVLPDGMLDHMDLSTMVLQPLSVGEEYFGYAIIDSQRGAISGETLQLDLSRALATIESKRRLAEYAEQLEKRVTLRTQQLEAEVAARRRTELDLVRLNSELRKSLFIDGLTRIANRTALDESLVTQWREHQSSGHTLSMIFVDVDHFKAYNDHYGHLRGDDVLRTVASCLSEAVRGRDDLAARYGGEEFAVILPQTDEAGAAVVAERIRLLVRAAEIPHVGSPDDAKLLTVSLGVASVRPAVDQVRVDHLIALADQALYRAKATGRDRVAVASDCEPLGDDRTTPTGWQI
jgi:diguanylate cyclase (GGDEF)-like protein